MGHLAVRLYGRKSIERRPNVKANVTLGAVEGALHGRFRRREDVYAHCTRMDRGWKVTDALRRRKVGVAAKELTHLKQKACQKLQVGTVSKFGFPAFSFIIYVCVRLYYS